MRQQTPGTQIRVPVLEAPTVQRVDVSSGLLAAADAAREIEVRRASLKANELRLGAVSKLADAQLEAEKQPFDQRTTFFEGRANEIKKDLTQNLGMFDGEVKSRFEADWSQVYLTYNVDVKQSARKGEIDHHSAVLDDTLTTLARQAAQMPDERQSAMMVEQAGRSIAVAQHGGILSETEAGARLREFSRGVEKNRVVALIDKSPNEGLRALQDTAKFQSLKEEDRLMLLSRAESKIQHQAAMADHAANRALRSRREMGDQAAKDGFDLLAKGQLTEEWMNQNKLMLDTSDYRMLRDSMQGGGSPDSKEAFLDIHTGIYVEGVDKSQDILGYFKRGDISPQTAKAMLDENKDASPVKRAKSYLATALKPSDLNQNPDHARAYAEAMVEFDRLWSENPKQDPDTLARQVLKRNSMAPDVSLSRRLPSPKFIVGDRSALDTQKTERNVAAFFMKKHAGDKARVKADPEFRREMQILQEWKADQERQARINAAAKGGTQ